MGSGADSPCQGEMARRARGGRVGDYEHKVLIWSRPRRRFAQSLVAPGEAQRSGFAGKRRSKGTNAVFAARRKRSGVDFATTSRRGQSHSPPAGGEIPLRGTKPLYHRPLIRHGFAVPPFPIPSGLRPSPLDKGSRPPRGRLLGGSAPSSGLFGATFPLGGRSGRTGGPVCRPYEKSGETLYIKL